MRVFVALFLFGLLNVLPWQHSEGGVLINEILADPPAGILGDANQDGLRDATDDEFVELVNLGLSPTSLSGWTLSDAAAVRHLFSDSSIIPAKGFFVVFGGGEPAGFEAFAVSSTGSLSLNNTGDTVFLRNLEGKFVDSFLYGSEGNRDTSLTRFPDGSGPFVRHSSLGNSLFSPELTVDGNERLIDAEVIPEPGTLLLISAGLAALVGWRRRSLLVLFFLCWVYSGTVSAEEVWKEVTRGIPEADFRTITVDRKDPRVVYVGTSKALYRTISGGREWKKVLSIHGASKAVNQIFMSSQRELFVATDNGLYVSQDGGGTWEKLFSGFGNKGRKVLAIEIFHTDAGKYVWIGTEEGLFRSGNGGKHWERTVTGISRKGISFLSIDPKRKVLYAAVLEGVYQSRDFGQTWERIFVTSVQDNGVEGLESGPEEDGDQERVSSEKVTAIVFSEEEPKGIFIGTRQGVYVSQDEGKSWSLLGGGGFKDQETHHLFFHQNALYAATGEGVFVFDAKKGIWRTMSVGLTTGNARYLGGTAGTPTLWAVTAEGVFKTEPISDTEKWRLEVKDILHHFDHEPTIEEIQEAAIRYAEVHPEKIIAWRRDAARQAYLPSVSTGIDIGIDRNVAVDTGGTTNPDFFIVGPDERGFDWKIDVSWDLGEILWNDDQTSIDVRSRLLVQLRDDVLDEVTRLYFERRRLQIGLFIEPPQTLRDKVEKELRLQELTADIDALTGGYLSQALRRFAGESV